MYLISQIRRIYNLKKTKKKKSSAIFGLNGTTGPAYPLITMSLYLSVRLCIVLFYVFDIQKKIVM